jgi:murein tripeptide amidase MpaA
VDDPHRKQPGMKISSHLYSGNIEVLDASRPSSIRLAIRQDTAATERNASWFMWFYFRVAGARGQDCNFLIENAAASRWHEAWRTCHAVASYDRETWFRVPTDYDGKALAIRHRPELDCIFYAYSAPYTSERHLDLLARATASPRVRLEVLGESLDGEDLDLLVIGSPAEDKPAIWVLARLHPGETQGSFAIEGLMERLIDEADAAARALLSRATFYVVPNINPDGSRRGNHRCNAAGVDLNRAWKDATLAKSPEVHLVQERMRRSGVAVCLDLHGDERTPYVWPVGTSKLPRLTERQIRLREAFDRSLERACPDYGPTKAPPGADDLHGDDPETLAIGWTAATLGAMSLILEFPFEDNADAPDPRLGWSPARSQRFGAALVDAFLEILDV